MKRFKELRLKNVELPMGVVPEKPTNADRIRVMSDEELAKIINAFTAYFDECNRNLTDTDCHNCELCKLCGLGKEKASDWLQQPFEGE